MFFFFSRVFKLVSSLYCVYFFHSENRNLSRSIRMEARFQRFDKIRLGFMNVWGYRHKAHPTLIFFKICVLHMFTGISLSQRHFEFVVLRRLSNDVNVYMYQLIIYQINRISFGAYCTISACLHCTVL